MPTPPTLLPRYDLCDYALFVSYAHYDNQGNNRWVEALRDAIWNRLVGLPRDIIRKGIHFSQENGPSDGHLGHELRERVAKSFAVLLVVGNRYADSRWCERELEMFEEIFGTEGTRSRLYVIFMTESARNAVVQSPVWKRVVAPDQVCIPMYQEKNPNIPITPWTETGHITQTIHNSVLGITNSLMEEIEQSVAQEKNAPATVATAAATLLRQSREPLSVVIAPCTANLLSKAETLRDSLLRSGANVSMLDRSVIDDYDPDARYPLGQEFAAAHTIIAPISECRPLRPDKIGGHISLVAEEWSKLQKSRGIIWYQPSDVAVADAERAAPKHLQLIKRLEPIYASEKAVANQLFTTGNMLRVYIEKHRQEPAYWIAHELDAAWKTLPHEPDKPPLDYCFLEIGNLGSLADDAAGVVLLMPEGIKDPKSLYSQMESIRRAFPRKGFYPGVVACLFNPPPRVQSGLIHDWAEIHFYRSSQDARRFVTDDDNKRWLHEFVQDIWHKYKNSSVENVH